jgi:outer membrane protein
MPLSPPRRLVPLILPLLIPLLVCGAVSSAAAGTDSASAPATSTPATPDDPNAPVKSLTLRQAEETALRNQPTLTQAHGLLEAAEGRVEEARAGYLPQVTLAGTYERTTGNFAPRPGALPACVPIPTGTGGTTTGGTTTGSTTCGTTGTTTNTTATSISWNPQYNYFLFGATATQLIYDFGQTSGRWSSAGASRDAAADNTRTAEMQTLLNVRRAYFQVRAQHDLVSVAVESMRNQEKHVEQTRAFVKTGIQPDINLATVLTALANAKVQLVMAQNNFEVAEAQLDQAMGVPVEGRFAIADDEMQVVPGEDGPSGPLAERALRARPEVANLADQRRAQELTVHAVRGAYGPTFGAIANVSDNGTAIDGLVPNWYAGLTLSWNIFQGGLTRGQVREAKGTLENLAGQEQAERLQVQVDVEQGRLGVQAAKATIGASEEAAVNARDQLTLAEGRYAHGLGSAVELGDAQVAYTTAEAQLVQAKFNLASARAQLLAALGER